MYNQPIFAPKQTSARIDFLRQGGRLIVRKGIHNVKILTEIKTKTNVAHTRTSATTWKTRTPTAASASCCWAYIKGQDHFIVLHQSLYFLLKCLNKTRIIAIFASVTLTDLLKQFINTKCSFV